MSFKSIVHSHPNFVCVDDPKDAEDIISRSGVNFQVRLCRLFLADSRGIQSKEVSAEHLVVCDFNGQPIHDATGPITLRKERFLIKDQFEYFETNGFFALDEPDPQPVEFKMVSGTSYQLPEYYKCKIGSTRATVAFDKTGQPFFLGLVGSRYTVIQNSLLAEDALTFLESTDPFLKSNRAVKVFAGGRPSFFGVDLAAGSLTSIDGADKPNLAHSIFLFHTHDKAMAYNHIWYVRDLDLENQPIIHYHKIPVKHTKNIKARATRITETLASIKGEYKRFYEDSEKLRAIEVSSLLDARKLLGLVRLGAKSEKDRDKGTNRIDDWLIDKIARHFIEAVASKRGFNLWSLYLALCDIDAAYWDTRQSESGLLILFEEPKAFKKRRFSRKTWVDLVDSGKL